MQVILNKGTVLRAFRAKPILLRSSKQQAAAERGRLAAEPVNRVEESLNKRVSKTSPVGFNRNMCWMRRRDVIRSLCSPAPHLLQEASARD